MLCACVRCVVGLTILAAALSLRPYTRIAPALAFATAAAAVAAVTQLWLYNFQVASIDEKAAVCCRNLLFARVVLHSIVDEVIIRRQHGRGGGAHGVECWVG